MVRKNQYQFHRRMRRKCINLCKSAREAGEPEDPILAPVEKKGVTMAALRRLAELASQSASSGSNRVFGVFQEVHRSFRRKDWSRPSEAPSRIPSFRSVRTARSRAMGGRCRGAGSRAWACVARRTR